MQVRRVFLAVKSHALHQHHRRRPQHSSQHSSQARALEQPQVRLHASLLNGAYSSANGAGYAGGYAGAHKSLNYQWTGGWVFRPHTLVAEGLMLDYVASGLIH
jgi:hypothetical protein